MLEIKDGSLKPQDQTMVYDLNSALFSDYALKLRTVRLPDGTKPSIGPDGDVVQFPVGTVISKTFYYPKGSAKHEVLKSDVTPSAPIDLAKYRLIETRILVHRSHGWDALPYVWNEAQSEARLQRTGDIKELTLVDGHTKTEFSYLVPDTNQCAGCHATNNTTRAVVPIGPKLRHLKNLTDWTFEEKPAQFLQNVNYTDTTEALDARARAYLDINCSHCHNEVGPADTSGLHLELKSEMGPNLGRCKMPIAAGTGTGNRKYGIVPGNPDKSIFVFRMESTNPAVMMPEVGRSLSHTEGVALIENWIASLEGDCS